MHAHRPRTTHSGVEHFVCPDHGATVRTRSAGGLFMVAGLQDERWFLARSGPQSTHEAARVFDALNIHEDRGCVTVVGEIVEQFAKPYVTGVTNRSNHREPDPQLTRPIQDCSAQSSRL